jgi:hypothetical protein
MDHIDASGLPGLPAPFWFVEFFKVLGFLLHLVPMNLWYAGVPLAVGFYAFGGPEARRFTARLMRQMPILVALGINFGIVPLLFMQVAYNQVFYPATILMAWFWLSIIVLLIPAYYGVYLVSYGFRERPSLTRFREAAGWITAAILIVIGFIFANAMSLMTNTRAWKALWLDHSVGAAPTGTILNLSDSTLWLRWVFLFGLAIETVAAWIVVDAGWLGRGESPAYRDWARRTAFRLSLVGAVWATVAGGYYVIGTWLGDSLREQMFVLPTIVLTVVTAASPWFTPAAVWLSRRRELTPILATVVGLAQVVVLGLNATGRQVLQNFELQRFFKGGVSAQPEAVQWGPMAMFLVTFAIGAVVVAWIVAQVIKAAKTSGAESA